MSEIEHDLFGDLVVDAPDETEEETTVRKKKDYHVATVRPPTRNEALASSDSLFDDIAVTKPHISELLVSQQEVRRISGTNGLKSVSLFTGCGGSATGFAWAGYEDIMSVEFVKAARETLAANYVSYLIEPEDVLKSAVTVANEMGIDVLNPKQDKKDIANGVMNVGLLPTAAKKVRKNQIEQSVNWEVTLVRLGGEVANDFRRRVNELVFSYHYRDTGTAIWGDDVRGLDADVFMKFAGIKKGELAVLEGSPPCKSFSTSGIREKGWGHTLHYSDERDQRTDDLFLEFLRHLDSFRPRAFIAENVEGITMGSAGEDVLIPLIESFDELGYYVEIERINAAHYSVAQARPRIIFMGVRKDQVDRRTGKQAMPKWPQKSSNLYTVGDAIEFAEQFNEPEMLEKCSLENYEIGKIWKTLPLGGSPESKAYQLQRCHPDRPSPTITASSAGNLGAAGPTHPYECRKFTIPEYRALSGFPYDYVFTGTYEQQGERMGRCVPPYLMKQIAESLADVLINSDSTREQVSFDKTIDWEQRKIDETDGQVVDETEDLPNE